MKAALTVCPRPRRWPCATTRSACASARGAVARARAAGREGGEASRERAGAVIGANTTRRTMAPEESYSYVSSNDASMACGRCMVPRVIGAPRPHVATVSPVPSTTAPGKEGISAIRPSNQKQRARPRELRVTGRLERHLRACAVRGGGGEHRRAACGTGVSRHHGEDARPGATPPGSAGWRSKARTPASCCCCCRALVWLSRSTSRASGRAAGATGARSKGRGPCSVR